MVSAWEETTFSVCELSTNLMPTNTLIPNLTINNCKIKLKSMERYYHKYISDILNTLEIAIVAFLTSNNRMKKPVNHPALNPSCTLSDYRQFMAINMPGIYRSYNADYMYENCPGLYDAYAQGIQNYRERCMYPTDYYPSTSGLYLMV